MNCVKWRSRRRGTATTALMLTSVFWGAPAWAQSKSSLTGSPTAEARAALSLETAIRQTLRTSPLPGVSAARRETLEAARDAAALKPQPSADITAENFGLPMGDLYDQFQITGTYSQKIERGGKSRARVELVNREIDLVEAESLIARLDLIKLVQDGFVEAQATSAKVTVARERLRVAHELRREVGRRVASAKDPIFAGTRAQTGVAEAEADLALAVHARDAALKRLAMLWGGAPPSSVADVERFLDVKALPAAAASAADLAIFEARLARARSSVELQRANAARDPTVTAGPRILASGSLGAVAGVSLPLGGRRLSQARVAEALAQGRQIEAEFAVERFNRERAIALAAEKVEESRHEVELVREEVIDNAEKTLEQVRFGYNRGFFSFADVSAAQRTLVDARERVIDAAERYHQARAELDRLTGRFINLAREPIQ
jgi:outer membrane protein, heavy metal efflux system